MHQRFVLPESCGLVESVSYVNVKPQFQQEVADGHVVLTGVYLIQVELKRQEGVQARAVDGIPIEEVDLAEGVAYFEYGLPLNRTLAGEELVTDYRMEQIEGTILSNGVLEIVATENIARKPNIVAVAQLVEKQPVPAEQKQPELAVAANEPVAQLQPEQTISLIVEKSGAAGIVEWLGLSNHYKTEKVQLNPILKQRVANSAQDEQ